MLSMPRCGHMFSASEHACGHCGHARQIISRSAFILNWPGAQDSACPGFDCQLGVQSISARPFQTASPLCCPRAPSLMMEKPIWRSPCPVARLNLAMTLLTAARYPLQLPEICTLGQASACSSRLSLFVHSWHKGTIHRLKPSMPVQSCL